MFTFVFSFLETDQHYNLIGGTRKASHFNWNGLLIVETYSKQEEGCSTRVVLITITYGVYCFSFHHIFANQPKKIQVKKDM